MPDPTLSISGRVIGGDAPCFVIAEIGINHGGDEALCSEMIDRAAAAGADSVKLQTVTPAESYHPDTESYRIFASATLSRAAHERLIAHARKAGVILFSTPGDPTALRELISLDMPAIKISSGLLTNLPLITMAAASGKPLVMSTGMARLDEVREAVKVARAAGCCDLALLQCTSLYPAPAAALNLKAMEMLREEGRCPVGYSDHYPGHLAAIASVACGAKLIEKHFTLDAGAPGGDHAISLEPDDFAAMVKGIREVEAMLGSSSKAPVPQEEPLREGRHRRLVAARDLAAGTVIAVEDVFLMRLPTEYAAMPARELNRIVGRRALCAIPRLSGLTEAMIDIGQ